MVKKILLTILSFFVFSTFPTLIFAADKKEDEPEMQLPSLEAPALPQGRKTPVELTGDSIEYSVDGETIIAKGNVEMSSDSTRLTCDRVEFSRKTNIAYASGNVQLVRGNEVITGERLTFNFQTNRGDFLGTRVAAHPMYGAGKEVYRVSNEEIVIYDGFMTTSDHDKPEFRMESKKIEVYPGQKMVARHVKFMVGNLPVLYLPWFTQRLDDEEPRIIFTPGVDKDWGGFLLSSTRYNIGKYIDGRLLVDYREKKDLAVGTNLQYRTPEQGNGLIRLYYMNERNLTAKRFYRPRPSPTIERERYKIEWRHHWKIDDTTKAVMQYYKISDSTFLKDYFENEYEKDPNPDSYFLLTKAMPLGVASFRVEARANRWEEKVERLPEFRYDLANQEILDTGLYYKSQFTYSKLTHKTAAPSEVRQNTDRIFVNNELSYPMKVSIIEFKPFVGTEHTYYSKTKAQDKYDTIRSQFKTGASLSTKFYRIFDVESDVLGLDINRLRHIVTPSVDYSFKTLPTRTNDQLDSFDGIDNRNIDHEIALSLENKLQTKRDGESTDLVRAIVSTPFRLKEDPSKGGFGNVEVDLDVKPINWMRFYMDSEFNVHKFYWQETNFDLYLNDPSDRDRWSLAVGRRWNRDIDHQLTSEVMWRANPKWAFKAYNRYDFETQVNKEQEFTITRDLHSWTVDLSFNETRGEGSEIWVIFTLKAFPNLQIDAGTSFNKRKAGTQSSIGK